jgi:hypothetical protein
MGEDTMQNGEPEILGTIILDHPFDGEQGKLFWKNADIWVLTPDGEIEATNTGCPKGKNAMATIVAAWGERGAKHKVWGLRLRSRQAERYYGLR